LQRALGQTIAPLEYLEGTLHPWVAFLIMPVFALANAGVEVHVSALGHPVAVAVALGLLLGKPAGILLAVFLAVRSGLARLPERTPWSLIAAGGVLSGIGFTMALFIAKIGILAGSALSAILGMGLMRLCSRLPAA
jgi:NhaA family Na+:H+ antiporter